MTSERCSNKASLERVNPEILDPYLYIKAQRAQFGVLCCVEEHDDAVRSWIPWGTTREALRCLIPLGTENDAERTIVGSMTLDHWLAQSPRSEAGVLDFIGISYVEEDQHSYHRSLVEDQFSYPRRPEVHALCVIPVNGKPGVFERRGVATISKEAWDKTAQFDENIILG